MSLGVLAWCSLGGYLVGAMCWVVHVLCSDPATEGGRRHCLGAWMSPLGPDTVLVVAGGALATVVRLPPTSRQVHAAGVHLERASTPSGDDLADLELVWSLPPAADVSHDAIPTPLTTPSVVAEVVTGSVSSPQRVRAGSQGPLS